MKNTIMIAAVVAGFLIPTSKAFAQDNGGWRTLQISFMYRPVEGGLEIDWHVSHKSVSDREAYWKKINEQRCAYVALHTPDMGVAL